MTRMVFIGVLLAVLSACTNPQVDLKSPCVGAEDSPCDRRAPTNQYV